MSRLGDPYIARSLGEFENLAPNWKHRKYTGKKLGIYYNGDIDRWMDARWRKYSESHRMFRHNPDEWLPHRYIRKYGSMLAS
jgi:hypothetical protein